MRTIALCCLITTFLFAAAVSSASASDFTSRLTFDGPQHTPGGVPVQGGGEDQLEDDSLTDFLNLDGSVGPGGIPTITNGDLVWGIINMTNTDASGTPAQSISESEQITVVYSAKVMGAGSVPGSFNLVPIADALAPYDLRNVLNPTIIADFTTGPDDESIFVVMSNETGTADPAGINPLHLTATIGIGAVADPLSVFNNISNTPPGAPVNTGWHGDLVGGLLGGDDFFELSGSFALGGFDRAAFSVQEDTFGGIYLPVDVFDFSATTHLGDVTLDVGTVTPASVEQMTRGWVFRDQGTFFVNVVPEPSTVALAAVACLALAAWRSLSARRAFATTAPGRLPKNAKRLPPLARLAGQAGTCLLIWVRRPHLGVTNVARIAQDLIHQGLNAALVSRSRFPRPGS